MTGLVRKATLFSACGLVLAGVAFAGVPSAGNSTIPCGIKLVGTNTGVADPLGQFSVTVKDVSNSPVANSTVNVDFSLCTPDIKLGTQVAQPFAGLTLDCPTHGARSLTNTSGVATFRIVGGANNSGGAPAAGFKCARVFADGVLLGNVNVAVYDQNGASGVGSADLSAFLSDFFSAPFEGRSDYDCTSTIGSADLSVFLTGFFASGSTASATAFCNPSP